MLTIEIIYKLQTTKTFITHFLNPTSYTAFQHGEELRKNQLIKFISLKKLPSGICLATMKSSLISLAHQHVRALMVNSNLELVFTERNILSHFLIIKKS